MQRAVGRCKTAVRNREGHFGAVSQERVDALASINEGGTAEDFKSFRPLLNSEETEAFLVSIRPLQDTLVVLSEIRQCLISHRVKGMIPLQVQDGILRKRRN